MINTGINAFFSYNEKLSSGAQPSAEQLEFLKKEGYDVIVNISTPSAKNALKEEAGLVENLQNDLCALPC
ncbi:MAG: hypothetical protein U0T82_17865 [Bacteroidales bacterium]